MSLKLKLLPMMACFLVSILNPVPAVAGGKIAPASLRRVLYHSHPCLAHIIDHEDGTWEVTRGNVKFSYGLPQADPGTKMASAGVDWQTNPWTQIRWALHYAVTRYGSECSAWAFWQRNYWW